MHHSFYVVAQRHPSGMNTHFRVMAHGRDLDVDALSGVMGGLVTRLWRRGGGYKNSGLELSIGDGGSMSWEKQLVVASSYIKQHEAQLMAAASFPGVEKFALGLYWKVLRDANVVGMAVVLPKSLLRIAIGVGLTPIIYLHFVSGGDDGP